MRKSPGNEHPRRGLLARWRVRAAERKERRLLSSRTRRRLAVSARRAAASKPTQSRNTVLLRDRAGAVRDELLEIALMLEHGHALDAEWISDVHKLLTDGCASPLYNRDVHISELRATLYYLRGERQVQPARLD
jgi:hypothetical protein